MFVSLEGIEGCGKSTQIRRLAAHLQAAGQSVVLTHEPGGSPLGPELRRILLSEAFSPGPRTELLLYAAERAEHVDKVIAPALRAGRWVLCDRYGDATRAYQCFGRGIPRAEVEAAHALATGGLEPDLTLFLRIPVEEGLGRARRRNGRSGVDEGRFEAEDTSFHRRVAEGYEALAAEFPGRIVVVDGRGGEDEVFERVKDAVQRRLAAH